MVHQGLKRRLGAPLLALLVLVLLAGCLRPAPGLLPAASDTPPPSPREFRAAWVATVANIDWPSSPRLSTEAQKAEARALVQRARELGLNTLILQVRPAADALYASALEPWSEYLTGTQGKPPEPFYDPLAFWIQEAHRAGLELHAWFNPYRARHSTGRSPLAPSHLASQRPELVRTYGDQLWLDPAEPAAADHVLAVILDVVRRYEVDGVHFDDYFYPYPVKDAAGLKVDFPDESPWQGYLARGGTLARADWRRDQVDLFVERVYQEVHRVKPQVRVGVSPFGLGRPDRRPPGVAGFSQYDELYAHAERWLEQGWLDYFVPQLYWRTEAPDQPFGPLLDGWRAQNPKGRPVWPGLFTSRLGAAEPWPVSEITGQIQLTRLRPGSPGHAHFSMVALKKDYGGIAGPLADLYDGPALVPAAAWLPGAVPAAPTVRLQRTSATTPTLRVERTEGPTDLLLAVWARYGRSWRFFTLPGGAGELPASYQGSPLDRAFASSVSRTGLESPPTRVTDARN